ncbi:MAG: metallophosphoesterase [Candidatus Woesearchaeota archaeon]
MFKPKYVMGDLHLGNDCKLFEKTYSKDFNSVDEYHKAIVSNWNSKVTRDDDIVLLLGDLGKKEYIEEVVPQLRGRLFVILGNHDNYSKTFYNKYFEKVFDHPIFVSPRIVFSHIPIPTEPGVINYHGHTHHVYLDSERHFNLCPEHHNYTPILYKKLEMKLSKLEKPNYKFLEEWYANIQKSFLSPEERDDLVFDKNGLIIVEESKKLVFEKKYKKQLERNKRNKQEV